MRRLIITRKKSFVGALIPYLIHFAYPGTHPDDPESQWAPPHAMGIRIQNGQSVSIPIREDRCAVVVSAITSTGAAGGPAYYVEAGSGDVELEIVTKYSIWHGSTYHLRPL